MHDAGRDICVVDALFEARPPFDPDVITEQAATLLRQWGVSDATGDAYAAAWPITAFARHGVRFHTAALTTSELYLHSLPLWTAGRARKTYPTRETPTTIWPASLRVCCGG
jgi:hypothetical protein